MANPSKTSSANMLNLFGKPVGSIKKQPVSDAAEPVIETRNWSDKVQFSQPAPERQADALTKPKTTSAPLTLFGHRSPRYIDPLDPVRQQRNLEKFKTIRNEVANILNLEADCQNPSLQSDQHQVGSMKLLVLAEQAVKKIPDLLQQLDDLELKVIFGRSEQEANTLKTMFAELRQGLIRAEQQLIKQPAFNPNPFEGKRSPFIGG